MIYHTNVFLIGPMGTGKSSIGRALAKEMKRPFYDVDETIEQKTGASVSWIFDVEGEEGFRLREKRVVDELTQKSNIVLATSGGAILDADNRAYLASRGTVIYLKTSLAEQFERTKNDSKRPLLQVDNLEETLKNLHTERKDLYSSLADVTFDTDQVGIKNVVSQIMEYLERK
jgi:shikimate kinase